MTPAQQIYNLLADMEPRTIKEISDEVGMAEDYVRGTVANLKTYKRVRSVGVRHHETPRVGTVPRTYTLIAGARAPRAIAGRVPKSEGAHE